MAKEYVFLKAKLLRRIGSSIIDLIIAFVIAIIFYLILEPFKYNSDTYNKALDQYNSILVSSNLYEYETDTTLTIISKDYETNISLFFEMINKDENEFLNQYKEESDLFNDDYLLKDNVSKDSKEYISFYQNVISKLVVSDYFNKDYFNLYDDALKVSNIVTIYQVGLLVIAMFIGLLIYYVIMVMFDKDYLTFGKKIFKLKIYSKKGNISPSRIQILFRELFYIFFEIILSVYSIYYLKGIPIPLIASLICLIFFKDGSSFHDLIASTFVVDDTPISNSTAENLKLFVTVKD